MKTEAEVEGWRVGEPWITSSHQESGDRHAASGGSPLYPHLGFRLCPLNSQENKFLLLQAIRSMLLCYGTPRKLVEWARQVIEG